MAGWYLVLILMNGQVTVNQYPMSEEGCQQQLAFANLTRDSVPGAASKVKAACVELK